jgi:hypothetical protein
MLFNSAFSPGVAAVGERQSLESLLLDPWEFIEEREPDLSQRTTTSLWGRGREMKKGGEI